ncbi:hypothetical protein [Afipia sp. P52-10]|uniref:hypothetical protein n=1 Tax=Afipia sp. P52-10 TaxID=1429916 RepID=UPI0004B926B0|nr:hypothetical protein [Afipia sp. P52-10]
MSEGLFDDASVEIPCPGCGHKHEKTLGWLKDVKEFTCDGCGAMVAVENAELRASLDGLDKAWGDVLGAFDKKR